MTRTFCFIRDGEKSMQILISPSSKADYKINALLGNIPSGRHANAQLPDFPLFNHPERLAQQLASLGNTTGLFRVFAEAEADADALEAFCERFGEPDCELVDYTFSGKASNPAFVFAKSEGNRNDFAEVLTHVAAIRECTDLWELLKKPDLGELAKRVLWKPVPGGHSIVYRESRRLGTNLKEDVIADPNNRPEVFQRFAIGDVVGPSWLYIERTINKHIKGRVSTQLIYHDEFVQSTADFKPLRLHTLPHDMLGAIWLQFAEAMAGAKNFEKCLTCGNWFEISLDASRMGRKYCQEACKSKAYRDRKLEAILLYGTGKTHDQIATELNVEKKQVKKWLGEKRGKGSKAKKGKN
jgi:hypothetical protein